METVNIVRKQYMLFVITDLYRKSIKVQGSYENGMEMLSYENGIV